jgi:hypothetical protein
LRPSQIGEIFRHMANQSALSHRLKLHLPYHGPALRTIACLIEENLSCHPSPNAKLEGLEGEWGQDIAESWTAMNDIKVQLEAAADRLEAACESADC